VKFEFGREPDEADVMEIERQKIADKSFPSSSSSAFMNQDGEWEDSSMRFSGGA